MPRLHYSKLLHRLVINLIFSWSLTSSWYCLLLSDAGLSDVPGLTVASNPLSPIVFLKLKNSTGSQKRDLQLLNKIVERVRTIELNFCRPNDPFLFISELIVVFVPNYFYRSWRRIRYTLLPQNGPTSTNARSQWASECLSPPAIPSPICKPLLMR